MVNVGAQSVGILSLCETLEQLHGLENVVRASTD